MVRRVDGIPRLSLPWCVAVLVLLALTAPGCTLQGAFVADERVEILAPADRAEVELPVTVDWSVQDFAVASPDGSESDDRGYFAIFIDRAPMAPGEDLEALAARDQQCRENPECPDEKWFAGQGIFFTTETSFVVESLVDTRPEERPEAPDRHEVTIVLLNGSNERIGETAFTVEFEVIREDSA